MANEIAGRCGNRRLPHRSGGRCVRRSGVMDLADHEANFSQLRRRQRSPGHGEGARNELNDLPPLRVTPSTLRRIDASTTQKTHEVADARRRIRPLFAHRVPDAGDDTARVSTGQRLIIHSLRLARAAPARLTGMSLIAPRFSRLAAAAIVTVIALPLVGCFSTQIPAASPSTASSPTASPPVSETSRSTLTFDEGAELSPTAFIQWGDGFMTDEDWQTVSPDDGNGGWTYGTLDGACTAEFWQGTITDPPMVDGDDSASSDQILALIVQSSAEEITPLATTGEFSTPVGGAGGVENRQVTGAEGDRSWMIAVRAFSQMDAVLYVIVDCTGADATATMDVVNEKNSIVVIE